MRKEFDYIIVGGGLSGLALGKELSKQAKKILVLEKGFFIRWQGSVMSAAMFYDKCAAAKSIEGVTIYRAFGVGGTSVVSCGNAVESLVKEFYDIGIDLKNEIEETKRECNVNSTSFPIGKDSMKIMTIATKLGYDMYPMPKFGAVGRCVSCGNCVVGCKYGAKWTALEFLKGLDREKVKIITNFPVKKIIISKGKAIGVEGRRYKTINRSFYAEKIILSAGGIGTPIILQNSGIEAGNNLFIDLFNVTYGMNGNFNQRKEVAMSVVCDKFHEDDGFILSPLVDNFWGFVSSVEKKYIGNLRRLGKMLGIMTKINDDEIGRVNKNGSINKKPTESDLRKLKKGSEIAKEILIKCGANPKSIIVTKPRGAHPGGTAYIERVVNSKLETKIKNLFVCDASILPCSSGLPPMVTLIALAKWFARNGG